VSLIKKRLDNIKRLKEEAKKQSNWRKLRQIERKRKKEVKRIKELNDNIRKAAKKARDKA